MIFYKKYKYNEKILKNFFLNIKSKRNIHFRDATIDDTEYIKRIYMHYMERGHIKKQNQMLIDSIVNVFIKGKGFSLLGKIQCKTVICYHGSHMVGFLVLKLGIVLGLEVWFLFLEESFHNKKIGRTILQVVEDRYSSIEKKTNKKIYVRCHHNSKAMKNLLLKLKYVSEKNSGKSDFTYFEKYINS